MSVKEYTKLVGVKTKCNSYKMTRDEERKLEYAYAKPPDQRSLSDSSPACKLSSPKSSRLVCPMEGFVSFGQDILPHSTCARRNAQTLNLFIALALFLRRRSVGR